MGRKTGRREAPSNPVSPFYLFIYLPTGSGVFSSSSLCGMPLHMQMLFLVIGRLFSFFSVSLSLPLFFLWLLLLLFVYYLLITN